MGGDGSSRLRSHSFISPSKLWPAVIVLTAANAVVLDGTGNTDCRLVFVVAAAARLALAVTTSNLESIMAILARRESKEDR